MFRLICVLIGYALGCVQTAYIVGKLTARIDIREHGSGNAGTTNVIRVIGKAAGALVFAADIAKGFLAFWLCARLFGADGVSHMAAGIYGGLGALLGHVFPFFLKFKGGKGFAAFLGLMLAADWRAALIAYAVVALIIIVTRYISLSALAATAIAPPLLLMFGGGPETGAVAAGIAVVVWVRHRDNIGRLRAGNENKLSLRKKKG